MSAAAAKIEGENARLRAVQIGELSRRRLAQTLQAQQTVFAQRGVSSDSATSMAVERKTVENANRDEAINVLGELNRASASDSAASGYSMAAKYAMPLATLQAGAAPWRVSPMAHESAVAASAAHHRKSRRRRAPRCVRFPAKSAHRSC